MKKFMFMAVVAIAALTACSKDESNCCDQPAGTVPIQVVFSHDRTTSRAVFDDTAASEPWEKKIHKLTLLAYNDAGKMVMYKKITATEIANLSGMLYLSESLAGSTCTIAAYANCNYLPINYDKLSSLLSTVESGLDRYNGYYDDVSTGKKPDDGFTMVGLTTVTIPSDGSRAKATIMLERTVAKIAVQIKMADDFPARHGGGIVFAQVVRLRNIPDKTYLFQNDAVLNNNPRSFSRGQNGEYKDHTTTNLFYVFPQGPCAPGDESYLELVVLFDQDGTLSTGSDFILKNIRIPLTGSGAGEIKRNGYYRIQGTITDFDALNLETTIEVLDWETPETEDLGDIKVI